MTASLSQLARTYRPRLRTPRLHERAGLLSPRRWRGIAPLDSRRDLRRLDLILELPRDRKIDPARVDAVPRLRDRVEELQRHAQRLARMRGRVTDPIR